MHTFRLLVIFAVVALAIGQSTTNAAEQTVDGTQFLADSLQPLAQATSSDSGELDSGFFKTMVQAKPSSYFECSDDVTTGRVVICICGNGGACEERGGVIYCGCD